MLVAGAAGLAFWALSGINQSEMRLPTSSRYQLPSAIFILLIAACLLDGVRIRRLDLVLAATLSGFAVAGGIGLMTSKAEDSWQPWASNVRARLAGIESARQVLTPDYRFSLGTSFEIPATAYLKATDSHGSPAYSEDEIPRLEPTLRKTVDASLVNAAGVAVSATPPELRRPRCQPVESRVPNAVASGPLRIVNLSGSELAVGVSHYSDPPGIPVGSVLPRASGGLDLPESGGSGWKVTLTGRAQLLCFER